MMSNKCRKRKACTESMVGEIQFGKDIIQHIQSFREDKCAAQTSLLSKSWYDAWATRPILVLQSNRYPSEIFLNFARKAIQKYIDQNIIVDKLKINVQIPESDFSLDKLISHACKLRVNELELYSNWYILPARLFEQRYLRKIHLHGCIIDQQLAKRVPWPHLMSLSLCETYINGDMFWQILSRCPLIEYLNMTECSTPSTNTYNVSESHNLKTLIVEPGFCNKKVFVEFGKCQFLNLTRLVLKMVKIDTAFFNNFAYKFPCLEDLTLKLLEGRYKNIQISSLSLKSLRFLVPRNAVLKIAEFEVPNVSKFILSCYDKHTISFTAVAKQTESEINICCCSEYFKFPKFLAKLRNLEEDLRQSKISLNISFSNYLRFFSMRLENIGILPIIENLMVSFNHCWILTLSEAVCGLLRCCRPKFIIINIATIDEKNTRVLLEKLKEQANQNHLKRYLHDLHEVSAEVFQKSVMKWQPVKSSSYGSEILCGVKEQLRFKLNWGSVTPDHTIITFVRRPEPKSSDY